MKRVLALKSADKNNQFLYFKPRYLKKVIEFNETREIVVSRGLLFILHAIYDLARLFTLQQPMGNVRARARAHPATNQ